MADFNNFTNYKQTESGITHDLKVLRDYSRKMKLDGNASAIDEVLNRLEGNTFSVAIVGEFKRGKSTLINALLAEKVLPTDVEPCSATLNKITYDIEKSVEIIYKDGRNEKIKIDQLVDYVTKLTPESEARAKTVKEAIVHYPVQYCKNGVTIIDTPGLNDDANMTEVTMGVLPQIDAALMVIMATAPFSEFERDFLDNKIITSDLGRVLFVVTCIDLIDEDDLDRLLRNIAGRIQVNVIAKAKRTYGEGSQEFENYKKKIGEVKVFGLSAKKALKAKEANPTNVEMLKASCFPEFEKELERFLTEERGAITLSVPLNRIKTSSLELIKAAQLRTGVLAMQKEEFNKKYALAMEEIEKIRRERKSEFERTNESAEKAILELEPAINSYWPSIENAAMNAIDSIEITSLDEIKGDEQQKKMNEKLTNAVRNAVSLEGQSRMENIQAAIEKALGKEAERFSGFESYFYQATDKIQELFTGDQEKKNKDTSKTALTSVALNTILGYGLGGVFTGFKEAGWKGALLGGATGIAGAAGAGLLFYSLALPFTWPVVIIGSLGIGIFSHLTSKWTLNKVFAKDKIDKYKNSFKDAIQKDFNEKKSETSINKSVREQVSEAFNKLKEKIKSETENILTDMQGQLDQIKTETVKSEADCENELKELDSMLKSVNEICVRADEIGKQITEVLSK